MPYGTFVVFNVAGGVIWAGACVLGGWAVGSVIATYIANVGYVVLGLVAVALAAHLLRQSRDRRRERAER